MRAHQRNFELPSTTRASMVRWLVAVTMLSTLGRASAGHAQIRPEAATFEGISGWVMDSLSLRGMLHVHTRAGMFAYDPTPTATSPRGRFRMVLRGDFFNIAVSNDQVYLRMREAQTRDLTIYGGAEQPLETIPAVLGPPLELGKRDGQPCIAGERIEVGAAKGSVERLPRCMLPSELWASGVQPESVRVFDGRVVFLTRAKETFSLWIADGMKAPTVVRTFADPVHVPLVLDRALLIGTRPWAAATPPALWKLERGNPALEYVGPFGRNPYKPARRFGDSWYYPAATAASGEELWRTDGTAEGTRQVTELAPGVAGSEPEPLVVFRGALYFTAAGWEGREIFRTDGSAEGTTLLTDLNRRGDSYIRFPVATDERLYFSGNAGLYQSDGTEAGTRVLAFSPRAIAQPEMLVLVGDTVYFWARDLLWPKSLWRAREGKIQFVAAPISESKLVVDGDVKDVWIDYNQRGLMDAAGDVGADDPIDFTSAEITASGDVAYVRYTTTRPIDFAQHGAQYQLFLDADRDVASGYRQEGADIAVGAEFLLQGDTLLRYAGSGADWSWTPIATAKYASAGRSVELSFDTSTIASPAPIGSAVLFRGDNPGTDDYLR